MPPSASGHLHTTVCSPPDHTDARPSLLRPTRRARPGSHGTTVAEPDLQHIDSVRQGPPDPVDSALTTVAGASAAPSGLDNSDTHSRRRVRSSWASGVVPNVGRTWIRNDASSRPRVVGRSPVVVGHHRSKHSPTVIRPRRDRSRSRAQGRARPDAHSARRRGDGGTACYVACHPAIGSARDTWPARCPDASTRRTPRPARYRSPRLPGAHQVHRRRRSADHAVARLGRKVLLTAYGAAPVDREITRQDA